MPGIVDVFSSGGGFNPADEEENLERYSWIVKGEFVGSQTAVVLNGVIDNSVRPSSTSSKKTLTRGRIFYLSPPNGTWKPGADEAIPSPVVGMLVGSDADSFDVNPASYTATPLDSYYGVAVMKQSPTLPFYLLDAGVILETSEFDPAESYSPGLTVLGVNTSDDNFDVAGLVRPGTLHTEHTIGTVTQGLSQAATRKGLSTIQFLGKVIPHN
jgi:hypothetical protein